jgi:hypothetical protein
MGREETRGEPEATFEETLGNLIQVAQGSMSETKPPQRRPADAPSSSGNGPTNGGPGTAEPSPQSSLRRTLESLRPDMALKVRTLMVAGRDGRDVGGVQLDPTLGDSDAAFATAARDASNSSAASSQGGSRLSASTSSYGITLGGRSNPSWIARRAHRSARRRARWRAGVRRASWLRH